MSLANDTGPGLHDVAVFSPAESASAALAHADLQNRLLRAGSDAVSHRELLQLLLAGSHPPDEAERLARALLDVFRTAPRALAARPDALRAVTGLSLAAVATLKAVEALGIAMARPGLPNDSFNPNLSHYERVIQYCRTLAGHRDVEQFHVLYLNTKNRLIRDECLQTGTINYTPVFPRQVCIRALEVGAAAILILHPHPSGDPTPSADDVKMTKKLHTALTTVGVNLHDHVIVTPTDYFSFQQKGLL